MVNLETLSSNNNNRQRKSSGDVEELKLREDEARGLIHDIIGRHAEFFADAENRIDFLVDQDPGDFLRIAQYANAKLRGEKFHQLRNDEREGNGALPMAHTPEKAMKPEVFRRSPKSFDEVLPRYKNIYGSLMIARRKSYKVQQWRSRHLQYGFIRLMTAMDGQVVFLPR